MYNNKSFYKILDHLQKFHRPNLKKNQYIN